MCLVVKRVVLSVAVSLLVPFRPTAAVGADTKGHARLQLTSQQANLLFDSTKGKPQAVRGFPF